MTDAEPSVLFVCVHNAGRSQMAAALLKHRSNGLVDVHSAGSVPADEVNPAVIEAMRELGIDLGAAVPKLLVADAVKSADVVVTMGCGDACPIYPGKRYLDWALDDPVGKAVDEVRPIRDEIDRRVRCLISKLGCQPLFEAHADRSQAGAHAGSDSAESYNRRLALVDETMLPVGGTVLLHSGP